MCQYKRLCVEINKHSNTNVSITGEVDVNGVFRGYLHAKSTEELNEFLKYIASTKGYEFIRIEFGCGNTNHTTFSCNIEFDIKEIGNNEPDIISICKNCGTVVQSEPGFAGAGIICPKCSSIIAVGFINKTGPLPDPSNVIENEATVSAQIDISQVQFYSTNHYRYNNGIPGNIDNRNAKRLIVIKPDNQYDLSYFVTLFNLSGIHPEWGDNIQIAPKRMKLISSTKDKITLTGHGSDPMLTNRQPQKQENYGIEIHLIEDEIDHISYFYHDRKVRIDFVK